MDRLVPKNTKPKELADASRHLFGAGGKRLRPVLALVSAEAVGGKARDSVEAAAALEILHTFTLIHDDIMDCDHVRRNVKTVHTVWGEPTAIVAGDALFAKVFESVAANAKRKKLSAAKTVALFETVSRASFEICQGQVLDMAFGGRKRVTEANYLEMVGAKTAALTEASTKVGAMLGGGNKKQVRALAKYGRLLGIAFQIQDDVLGITGVQKKFGKPIGSDIQEGKRTLLVVHALKVATQRQRATLKCALGKKDAKKPEVKAAIKVLQKTGSIEYAASMAERMIENAKKQLRILKDSESKEFLIELADFVITREI